MTTSLDHAQLLHILAEAAERLEGDWLVVGGCAAAVWFDPARKTEDVDLVPMDDSPTARFRLLELAETLGLPIEALNSAADFFVRRIDGWRTDLVLLQRGRHARIFRPGPALFLQLKLRRLTDVDLGDCEALLRHVAATGEAVDLGPVLAALRGLAPAEDAALAGRRLRLEGLLGAGVVS